MNTEQNQMFNRMREALKHECDPPLTYLSDNNVMRYLEAYNWVYDDAFQAL